MSRSIVWVNGQAEERAPKCRSYRVCPLSDRALQAVDVLQQRYTGKYLISGDTALRPDSWSRKLKSEMAKLAQAYPGMPEDVYKRQPLQPWKEKNGGCLNC